MGGHRARAVGGPTSTRLVGRSRPMLGRSTNPDQPRPHVKTAVASRHQSQHCPPLRYALRHNAISSNPCDRVDFSTHRAVGCNASFEHSPLTARYTGRRIVRGHRRGHYPDLPGYPACGLMVAFLAYSGLRASENAGLEIRDLVFTTGPNKPAACSDAWSGSRFVDQPSVRRLESPPGTPRCSLPPALTACNSARLQWRR
jgi:hypothetical protein